MRFRRKILFTALCLWALVSACISEASVTIKGKPLDEIDDIVSTATDGGTAEMKKYSLGVLANETIRMDVVKSLFMCRGFQGTTLLPILTQALTSSMSLSPWSRECTLRPRH